MAENSDDRQKVILVTGPSGAGRSTALNALEDAGFETIDNLPLNLVPRLLDGPKMPRPLALGIDVRNRQFSPEALIDLFGQLSGRNDIAPELLFLDCAPDVLLRRYSETRRRHPLAPRETPAEGIARECALLEPIHALADVLIDTGQMTPHDLRARVQDLFAAVAQAAPAVSLLSFSYKRGLPHGADVVLDCRFLQNPYWDADLRSLTGQDPRVIDYVQQDPRYQPFLDRALGLVSFLLPAFQEEGKAHVSIAFGCTGGQHRSVAVTEKVAHGLAQQGWRVSIRHREIERRGLATVPQPHAH